MKRCILMAVLFGLLTIGIGGLWGCSKTPTVASHTPEEITAVAISCSEMDQSYSYSFWLRNEADAWLFCANCFIQQNTVETELIDCAITTAEKDECFALLTQNDTISLVENYEKDHAKSSFLTQNVADGSQDSIALTFSDGTQCRADESVPELVTFFYDLAEKYGQENSNTES